VKKKIKQNHRELETKNEYFKTTMKKKKHKYSTNIYDIKLSIYNLFCILIYLLFNKNRFAYFNDCGCRSTSVIRKRVSIKSSKFGDSK